MMISPFDIVENTVGKGENAGYQHFLFSHRVFQIFPLKESLNVRIVWYRVKLGII